MNEWVQRYLDVSFATAKMESALIRQTIDPDLTEDQYFVLRYIFQKGTCIPTELAEKFNVKKSAITAIINRLWEKGIVNRTRDEKDRRVVYLSLTTKGRELFITENNKILSKLCSVLESINKEELTQFVKMYEKLYHVIVKKNGENLK